MIAKYKIEAELNQRIHDIETSMQMGLVNDTQRALLKQAKELKEYVINEPINAKDTSEASLNIKHVSKMFSDIGRILLSKDVAIGRNLDGFKKFVVNGDFVNNTNSLYEKLKE